MTSSKLKTTGAVLAAAGGFAWLVKLAVIATADPDAGAVAVFYLLGVALLALGGAVLAASLVGERHIVLRILAGVAGIVGVMLSFMALDAIAQAIVGDAGPTWFPDESGILLTALAWLGAGLLTLRPRQA